MSNNKEKKLLTDLFNRGRTKTGACDLEEKWQSNSSVAPMHKLKTEGEKAGKATRKDY